MKSILETCKPREDIISGTFNPEIFTAGLSHVVDHYRGKSSLIHSIYTDAEQFYKEATYPTEGLKLVLADVFGRIAGDSSLPSIHRLETAFGGGKTHTLIALTHLAFKGNALSLFVSDIVPKTILPKAQEISVVGIAGDELPVHKTQGADLVPYTLWGEIAYQVGGEELYSQIETDVDSYAAPGKNYFETVFEDKKILIMVDELAQYTARVQAARPDGGEQLAAFLMALLGYVRKRNNMSVVITLAGMENAFANQTARLADLISKVKGEKIDEPIALGAAQQAQHSIRSVISRDATTVVPVQAAEISRVLAKRLFKSIDPSTVRETANEYMEMYRIHSSSLPDTAIQEDFRNTMTAHYPFHPTLIRFLNEKMSTIETFQGTRGVLRVLSLVVRNLWDKGIDIPMIHTCHFNLKDAKTINEILGRTGGGDLLPVLNTDVGGPDSTSLAVGRSYAQMADKKNPHPEGYPLYEHTWKTVFLHSLVGRSEMLESNIFGLTEQTALFSISFPGMTPPQVETALKEIDNSAQYLRFNQGRYYASLEPSVNRALTSIRGGLKKEQIDELLIVAARKIVKGENNIFHVIHDVYTSEDIPDNKKQPVLAIIALDAEDINGEECITTAGPNRPRINQNLVFLLVPRTVREQTEKWNRERSIQAKDILNRMQNLARDVMARRKLKIQPENYGIRLDKLIEQDFENKTKQREMDLLTIISQAYDGVWFPSASGGIIRKEIKTSGGEGGTSLIEGIRRVLKAEGELITTDMSTTHEIFYGLGKLFFENSQTPSLAQIRENFSCRRSWPVLENMSIVDQIIRSGVVKGAWCLFRMVDPESTKPDEFYSRDTESLPFDRDLSDEGWSIIKLASANQRGWGPAKVDKDKIKSIVAHSIAEEGVTKVENVISNVKKNFGEVPEDTVIDVVKGLVSEGKIGSYSGDPAQQEKPADLIYGHKAGITIVKPDSIITTPATIAKRGWIEEKPDKFQLTGQEGANRIVPLLRQIGSLYARGAKSKISALDLVDLEIPKGGHMRLTIEDVGPEGMKQLGELFEVLAEAVNQGEKTEADIEIDVPDDDCLFLKELKK